MTQAIPKSSVAAADAGGPGATTVRVLPGFPAAAVKSAKRYSFPTIALLCGTREHYGDDTGEKTDHSLVAQRELAEFEIDRAEEKHGSGCALEGSGPAPVISTPLR
jgi:hypothetical protein